MHSEELITLEQFAKQQMSDLMQINLIAKSYIDMGRLLGTDTAFLEDIQKRIELLIGE